MKKTYIFKTKDGLHEMILRGSKGQQKMENFERRGKTRQINLGGIVTTINTIFETKEDLEKELMY